MCLSAIICLKLKPTYYGVRQNNIMRRKALRFVRLRSRLCSVRFYNDLIYIVILNAVMVWNIFCVRFGSGD